LGQGASPAAHRLRGDRNIHGRDPQGSGKSNEPAAGHPEGSGVPLPVFWSNPPFPPALSTKAEGLSLRALHA